MTDILIKGEDGKRLVDVVHERTNSSVGAWDEEAEIAEWHQCGPRGGNDAVHDTIVDVIQELRLSGVLKTTGNGWGCSYDGEELNFAQGEKQDWTLISEGSYNAGHGISLRPAEPVFISGIGGAETSDDFEATVDDFEREFWERINSGGEDETFCSNQEELMSMIVRGWIRFDGIMCEVEDERMIITMTPTSSMVKVYGYVGEEEADEEEEEADEEEAEAEVADIGIADHVKKRRRLAALAQSE
uniref:Uncharacterized protein n=1 Tax=Florenciella parvula TaxID=236787 RepID=A0A7S2FF63_9STRA|mmetsp:Transcript_14659/g.30736  ORF Transcript_14659/g.30736 Transcript_14659/m.30736 type:complete len:244 (+) Transcript_14659:136-867(+)|eukprot:CAMPEP_0182552940 /NCGR_PEP_ID=MMETSP1323-20130603/49229_1 /TAXON_ID=236787 /ORGANISM="Florenciella parvula, Strain RCC1693" /LENGTH=243 /DNA_ID=CAMNT_0024764653 /DNA_START=136 /DNA_END=867 /DNA_ORIENTATION=+